MLFVGAGLFLAGGCSSEKPAPTVEGKAAESAKPAEATKIAEVTAPAMNTSDRGEALFKQHCIKCHKNGGNIIRPEKTLRRSDLAANNIKTPEDIVRIMRNPGKGMMKYSEEKVPDDDAKKIGEYILNAFE